MSADNLLFTQTSSASKYYHRQYSPSPLHPNWRHFLLKDFPFKIGRLWAFQRSSWIALLDDDDFLNISTFNKAADIAAANPELGAVLCDWDIVEEESGEILPGRSGLIRYSDFLETPLACHQLALVNCAKIPPEFFAVADSLEFCWEWLLTAGAILNAGAIHLQEIGYYWNQWEGQHHRQVGKEIHKVTFQKIRNTLLEFAESRKVQLNLTVPTWKGK